MAWWAAEGDARDWTGINSGTLQGGVGFEAGYVGSAFAMHGGVDSVKIAASSSLNVGPGNGLAIEAWIYPQNLSDGSPLVEWNHEGTNFVEWGVQLWILKPGDFGVPQGSLFANLVEANGTPHYIYTPGQTITGNVWQHVALTYDKASGQARLYLNGQIVVEAHVGSFDLQTTYNLFLGRRPAGDRTGSYVGLLDEVAIYSRALAQTEIQGIFNAGAAGKCQGIDFGRNQPPYISSIPNQSILQGTSTGTIPFTVDDYETAADSLVVAGSSSNPTLVPQSGLVLGGSGANRTVTINPATNQSGTATITLTVNDGQAARSTSFTLTVQAAQGQGPTISPISDQIVIVDQPTTALPLALTDPDTPLSVLQLTGNSSNPALVPNTNIVFGTAGGRRYATVAPLFGQIGAATITITVSDGTESASTAFSLTVNPPPAGSERFVNPSQIDIPANGSTSLYPSGIEVRGMKGMINNLVLSIDKFTHADINDVSMLLVGPTGQSVLIFSHVSGNRPASSVRICLTDASHYPLPQSFDLWSEPLRPTAYPPAPVFPVPAPAGPYAAPALSTFNGLSANGTWSLYVYDEYPGDGGSIVGGWSLLIGTSEGGGSTPTISDIPDQSTPINTPTPPISFTINDADTAVEQLTLDKSSSNTALVPAANIVFGGTGATRTVTVTPAANQVGTATITVTVSDGALSASDVFQLTVNPPTEQGVLTVNVDNAIRAYGVANPAFSGSLAGLENGDNITATFISSATPSDSVGRYDILPILDDPDGKLAKYTVVTNVGTLTISPAALRISADNKSRTYGEENPALTGSIVGARNGDDLTLRLTTTATANGSAGTYDILPNIGDPAGKLGNYNLTTIKGTLTVDPAVLIGKADDKARSYGEPNPLFTVGYKGFVFAADANTLAGSLVTACSANTSSPPGTYAIFVSGQTAPNYRIVYQKGTLTVSGAALVIDIPSVARLYGGTNPALTGTVTGIRNADNIIASYTTTATPASPADIYPITVSLGDQDGRLGNYNVIVHNGALTVNPAPLVVSADDKTRGAGLPNPPLTGSIRGIQNGDDIKAVYTTTATTLSLPGNYPITPTLNDPNNKLGNYRVSTRYGTLTVTLLPIGLAIPIISSDSGLPVLDVAAHDSARIYGDANPPLTGTVTGLQDGDNITVTYITTATPESPADIYAITPVLHDPDRKLGNYSLIAHAGTLTVNPAKLTVSADDLARSYDAPNPSLTGTTTGLHPGDNITATFATTAIADSPPGAYPITAVIHDPNERLANYSVNVRGGILTISGGGKSRALSIAIAGGNGSFVISGTGNPNVLCAIQESSDLIQWQDIGTAATDASGELHFNAGHDANSSARFFRAYQP